jgi:hypothetical protein
MSMTFATRWLAKIFLSASEPMMYGAPALDGNAVATPIAELMALCMVTISV